MKKFFILLGLSLLIGACTPHERPRLSEMTGPRSTLVIEVYGFRSLKGNVLLSVFRENSGFPEETELALINLSLPATSGRVHFDLPQLPYGRYSYSILHDENGNGTMDQSLLGIPREGYALSNNLEGHFGQPEAEEALFEVGAKPQLHELRIHYVKRKGQGPFGH